MAHLIERRYLKCPKSRAQGYLADALQDVADSNKQLPLRLQVNINDVNIEKEVLVQFSKGSDPMHFDQPWTMHWTPAGGGPYPDFDGTLTVRADEDDPTCALELEGDYLPPLGEAGKVFDAVVGHRIAANTAQALLATIGDGMEERYSAEEAVKVRTTSS